MNATTRSLSALFPGIMGGDPGNEYEGIDKDIVWVFAAETCRRGAHRAGYRLGDPYPPSWSAIIRAYENVGD